LYNAHILQGYSCCVFAFKADAEATALGCGGVAESDATAGVSQLLKMRFELFFGGISLQVTDYPEWWYRGRRPQSDDAYFENLCRVLFQTGLNWAVVEKKWPTIKVALCEFDVDRIAAFTEADLQRLLNDKGIIRNPYKLHAIVENAKQFQQIRRRYDGFQAYLDSFDKSDNYALVLRALSSRFERIGPTTAALFLYSVGENIKPKRLY